MFEQLDRLAEPLQDMLGSPWLWVIVLLVSGLDALLPFMPSETTVVLVAVLIGPNPPLLALLAVVAAAGALAGDCLGYAVGRCAGPRATARLLRGARGRTRHAQAGAMVERHAATLVIAGRFLPGGRVVAALCTGGIRFPVRRFVVLDTVGAGLWALYGTALGGFGGAALTDSPAKALLLASGVGAAVAAERHGRRDAGCPTGPRPAGRARAGRSRAEKHFPPGPGPRSGLTEGV